MFLVQQDIIVLTLTGMRLMLVNWALILLKDSHHVPYALQEGLTSMCSIRKFMVRIMKHSNITYSLISYNRFHLYTQVLKFIVYIVYLFHFAAGLVQVLM